MGFDQHKFTKAFASVTLTLGLGIVLAGCPDDVPVAPEAVATPDPESIPKKPKPAPTPSPTPSASPTVEPTVEPTPDAATGPEQEQEDEVQAALTNPDFIWSDPIDWFFLRIFSRRFFRDGEEFTPGESDPTTGNGENSGYHRSHKQFRNFHARSLFKLFATNVQKHESGDGQSALHRLLSALFRFRHEDYDVIKVLVNIKSVEVRKDNTWTTVQDFGQTGRVFDFVALHEGGILELGEFPIDSGSYTKMRLNLGDSNKLVVDEGNGEVERNLVIPFFQTKKIELVRPFDVTGTGLTSVRIDFDLAQSVYRGFFNAYWLTPVMRILGVESGTPSSAMIEAAAGGVVEIMNEVAIVIPPGALAEDTQVTIRPAFQLLPHTTADLLILGQEYVIEPEGLQLNAPAQVVMNYSAAHVTALGLNATTLDMYKRAADSHEWTAAAGTLTAAEGKVQAEISVFGRLAIGGHSTDVDMSQGGGCINYADAVALVPTAHGIDPQSFYAECRLQSSCYQHGGRTYGKSAGQCLDEFFAGMTARCESICVAAFGQNCTEVSPGEKAGTLYTSLIGPLHDNCLVVAGRMFQERDAVKDTEYPATSAQTCNDYAGLGVSCETPVCTLEVDQSAIPIDTPTDLHFNLSFSGSVNRVEFDGSVVYEQLGVALPIEDVVAILDEGRSLSAAKTFTATVSGPANESAQCSVTVDVIEEPDPCTIVITPDETTPGGIINLFVTVLPGYNAAFMDIRTQGVMAPIGLSAPDASGNRYFSSNTRPSGTRSYSAHVTHDDGDEFTCSANVVVQ